MSQERTEGSNMKITTRCFIVAVTLAGCLWMNQVILWPLTGVRLACNSEYARVMRWTEGGYDSWGFDYSHGHQFDGTNWRNLWHWPKWHRTSFRAADLEGKPQRNG